MQSTQLIQEIEHLPSVANYEKLSARQFLTKISSTESDDIAIETACGTETALISLFENRNIPDTLNEAYKASFVNSNTSLYNHYSDILHKGEQATSGFINNLKGKLFEIQLEDGLNNAFPEYHFSVASNPNNPIWDLKGINIQDGSEVLIQAKMGATGYASDVIQHMHENPEVLFIGSKEIHDSILSVHPEFAHQLIDADISNYDFTNDVQHNLHLLSENLGIDVPDSIGEILPYVSEIILGIRLIWDIIEVQRDFKSVTATEKSKISAVKAITILSRFGISTLCTTLGATGGTSLGSVFPVLGSLAGGILGSGAGAIAAYYLNKELKPYFMDFALGLVDLDYDDLFYLQNKNRIDTVALSFTTTKV